MTRPEEGMSVAIVVRDGNGDVVEEIGRACSVPSDAFTLFDELQDHMNSVVLEDEGGDEDE